MFKVIGIVMILVSCGIFTFSKVSVLTKKYENLKEIKKAIVCLKHELCFSVPEISVLCKVMAEKTKGEVSDVLHSAALRLEEDKTLDFETAWNDEKKNKELFSAETEKIVSTLFKDLGKMNLDIELDNIGIAEKRLEATEIEEREKYKKDKRLILTLGAALGALILIVVI